MDALKLSAIADLPSDPWNISGVEPLTPELVERGEVLKSLIYKDHEKEVALLTLYPHSKIKKHRHVDDKECYFDIDRMRVDICSKGKCHELENNTDDMMFVLSIKYKD